jgi:hypothetical protein
MTTLEGVIEAKFKGVRSNRFVTAIIATRGVIDGKYVDPSEVDFDLYLARGGAVLVGHDSQRQVASCTRIERASNALAGECVFPPEGRDDTADRIFNKVWNREICCVSAGLSFPRGARPLLLEWSFVANGLNTACKILSGFKPDNSTSSAAHMVANIRASEEEKYSRQWRIE